MTKSRQSAIKLRLSRLIKCLVALGCLKLAIMGAALLDLPMPAWFGDNNTEQAAAPGNAPEFSAKVSDETLTAPVEQPAQVAEAESMPLGSQAAELAAASKPRRPSANGQTALPAPLVTAGPASPLTAEGAAFIAPLLPEPPALDAPLAQAGVSVPEPAQTDKVAQDDSLWNMLAINSLPIPGLGSVKAANAAALDMPVPQAAPRPTPFTPAEQLAAGQPTVMPGAPPLPANIPGGQTASGAPIPPRYAENPLPGQTGAGFSTPPAPNIPPRQSTMDANTKSQELARQEQDILMLRQQMDQRLKDLQTAEDKMKDILKEAKDIEEKKVKSLVLMYGNMKPRMAAQALENMDERIAVRILSGMAPKQSGEILTYTNPAKTAKFTEMITRLRTTY